MPTNIEIGVFFDQRQAVKKQPSYYQLLYYVDESVFFDWKIEVS